MLCAFEAVAIIKKPAEKRRVCNKPVLFLSRQEGNFLVMARLFIVIQSGYLLTKIKDFYSLIVIFTFIFIHPSVNFEK